MKIIKDLWNFIRYIIPNAWKTHRTIMKNQRAILKLENKYGVFHTFLRFLEEAIAHDDCPEEEIKWMLGTFIDCSDDKIRNEKEWEDILLYVEKYKVDPLGLEVKSG